MAVSQVDSQATLLKVLHQGFKKPVGNRSGPAFVDKQCGCPIARKGLIPSGEGWLEVHLTGMAI